MIRKEFIANPVIIGSTEVIGPLVAQWRVNVFSLNLFSHNHINDSK